MDVRMSKVTWIRFELYVDTRNGSTHNHSLSEDLPVYYNMMWISIMDLKQYCTS